MLPGPFRVSRRMRALLPAGLLLVCSSAFGLASQAQELDLGPLEVGMRLLRLSTRDLRVKPEYVEDQVGGGRLRLPFVTDGLRGARSSAARARALGYQLTDPSEFGLVVQQLCGLISDDTVLPASSGPILNPNEPLGSTLQALAPQDEGDIEKTLVIAEASLPLELRQAVAELAYGVARANELLGQALAALSPENRAILAQTLPGVLVQERTKGETIQALRLAAAVDLRSLVLATCALTASVSRARETLERLPLDCPQLLEPQDPILFSYDTPLGPIVVAGPGPNVHNTPAAILVDVGGRDRYELACPDFSSAPPVRVVIDLAGADTYAPTDIFGPSGALLGLSILVDESGNDDYTAREPYAFAAALIGAGILVDAAGDDRYLGKVFCEGAAMFGLGLLMDVAGDDVYEAELYAQGFGSVSGVGALVDRAGRDRYQAGRTFPVAGQAGQRVLACAQGFGLGLRQVAPGGIGILADADGADIYTADTYSQGSGWWLGAGLLFDRTGDDQYQGDQYSQGASGFLALGFSFDESGNDRYAAEQRSQGFGLERGIGLLRDGSGNDSYTADRLAQGAALGSGIGLLADIEGKDVYLCRDEGLGFVASGDTPGTMALFADGGGTDSYAGLDRNNLSWSDGQLAIGVDSDDGDLSNMRANLPFFTGRTGLAPRQPVAALDIVPIPGEMGTPPDLDALWASATMAADSRQKRDATRTLAHLGEQAVPYLAAKLADPNEDQIRVAQDILAEIGTAAVPELLRLMDEGSEREARAAMAVLTMISDPRAAGHLLRQAKSPRWRTRAAAAGGMGAQYGEETRLALEQLLRDPDEDVRRSAVVALRRRGETDSAAAIAALLGDPVYAVRSAAADALVALVVLGADCPQHVFSLVGSEEPDIRLLSIETCGRLGSKRANTMLMRLLESPDWADRAFAAEAICRIGDPAACEVLRARLEHETNGLVKAKARAAMKATRLLNPLP